MQYTVTHPLPMSVERVTAKVVDVLADRVVKEVEARLDFVERTTGGNPVAMWACDVDADEDRYQKYVVMFETELPSGHALSRSMVLEVWP